MEKNHQEGSEQGRECPCKKVPLYLSSFTAAEHGDVHSLFARGRNNDIVSLATRQDSAGNTPLHLAAQHGHVAVVSALLNGCNNVNTTASSRNNDNTTSIDTVVNAAGSGATPLHRASYSGAIGTMRLLLDIPSCNVLVQDTSFGDLATPLHKACAGGRYLAVQVLLDSLQERNLLQQALSIQDSTGKTPLQLAKEKQQSAVEERYSVSRWDTVAGGKSDWDKCVQLLESTMKKFGQMDESTKRERQLDDDIATMNNKSHKSSQNVNIPAHLRFSSTNNSFGGDECCVDGRCLTASWEKAFQSAIQNKVLQQTTPQGNIGKSSHTSESRVVESKSLQQIEGINDETIINNNQDTTSIVVKSTETQTTSLGRNCAICGKICVALYPLPSTPTTLACKKCYKSSKVKR